MRKIIVTLLMVCGCSALQAQEPSRNFIITRTMLNEAGTSCLDGISYYDGLGRPFQQVQVAVRNGARTGTILASLQEYDGAGRKSNSWLPVPVPSDYVPESLLKSTATGSGGYGDSRPYGSLIYEPSPLDRVLQQYGPGAAWHSASRPLKTEYLLNTADPPLDCKLYGVNNAYALTGGTACYAAGQLSVVKSTDEDQNVSYRFTDKLGRLVLERRMQGGGSHDTYYVYNALGNLCFVLQPMYQENADLGRYAFCYRYDTYNRCVWKQLPGAQHVLYEYDNNDRLAFSQDGNQRSQSIPKWTYYLYDALGRLTQQGECTGKNASSNTAVHVRNYYDGYGFVGSTGFPAGQFTRDTSGYGKGSLTGSVVTVSGSVTKLYASHYYDIRGREVKRVQGNLLGGYDVTSTVYTFTDKPLAVTHTHTASGKATRTETYTYTYDHADRVSKVEHTLGGTKVTLAAYAYDNLGRLQSKSLHGSDANKQTYSYNVRSWLTGISGTKFTQTLSYNNGTAGYNGNITAMDWTANGNSHRYSFSYDGLNRLKDAIHGAGQYTEKVTGYDKNGNILSLQRYGQLSATACGLIDNLTFTLNGNQLNRVDDAVTASAYNGGFEFKDGAKQTNEYTYDANGNLTKDLNKGITNISYNCLNLPSVVTFSDGSTITYTYAADGTKLRTVHKIGTVSTMTDYCSDVVYENGVQKLLFTDEGYVTLSDSKYHYYLKDHQGNNRVVISQSGAVEETNHYYPFGGVFASTGNAQPYKYNGKEYDSKKGLNWYDYGARHYNAALGRFTTVDPLAEMEYSASSYTYCLNNPIQYIDPTGCLASTHTDSLGNVVDVYNDRDLGVYKHNTDFEGTRQELAENYSSNNTAAGGERLGRTEYWDEFLDPMTNAPFKNMQITFGRSFDSEFANYAALALTMNIITLAKESSGNGKMDIKKAIGNIGGLFRGKYITSRSLGNYLAGYNAAKASISFDAFQKLAGALHIEENYGNRFLTKKQMASIILFGTYNSSRPDLFRTPLWGEVYYQFRMSRNGWKEGIR